jgi:endonuclease III
MKEKIKVLLQKFPYSYSEELGIDLKSKKPEEIFKWFLASILFAHRIPENAAKSTFKEFEKRGIITPEKILETGWSGLVSILDAGKYTRYDFSTASALLEIMKSLKEKYGSLENLYAQSKNQAELEEKLKEFKRVGPTTVSIFLRELRGIWKVDPLPSKFTLVAAKNLKLIKSLSLKKALEELKEVWKRNRVKNKNFVNFETALLRLGKNYCLKNKCKICDFKKFCEK